MYLFFSNVANFCSFFHTEVWKRICFAPPKHILLGTQNITF